MPPFRLTNLSSASESGLYAAAYRMTRDHLLLVRLSALAGSAVHRIRRRMALPDQRLPTAASAAPDALGRLPGLLQPTRRPDHTSLAEQI
jgi:hypothetical protein